MRIDVFPIVKKGLWIGIILTVMVFGTTMNAMGDNLCEEAAVLKAARQYLDAEVRKDYSQIYACLSPSSAYCASHNYEDYRKEALSSPTAVSEYQIINITYIKENEDREKFPHVEKFAEVEVEVVVYYSDTKKTSDFNIGFIFIKEGGKWYKS